MKKGHSIIAITSLIIACYSCQPEVHTTDHITVPEGFVVEHLHFPSESKLDQGSWVSICKDDQGRLIASDQYGSLYRITPPPIEKNIDGESSSASSETKVEEIPIKLGHAQGLLWAFNSLYVSVNASEGEDGKGSGFYRVTDTDGDDMLDQVERLKGFEGNGEHGPHAILLSPDKKHLYVLGGNHTDPPSNFQSILSANWQEDNLFPVIKDPRGHANDRMAPGGWIAITDPEGKNWEIVSSGFRNSYDMAFNEVGDLFVFDSDMEWDLGMPWYRPIRVVHATLGSEFGWRTGSGKFPPYYPDNLPPVVNIGQGSPTGVVMGKELNFPSKYQDGMLIMDWSFGTMYHISLEPNGSSYTGVKEEFLSGVPLPLTDMVIGDDGALYFTTGGRRVESHLYRVFYAGEDMGQSAELVANDKDTELFNTRNEVEEALWTITRPENKEKLTELSEQYLPLFWEQIGSEDRFIRYTARVGLEQIPVDTWKNSYLKAKNPYKVIEGAVAMARLEASNYKEEVLSQLAKLDYSSLNEMQKLGLIRAYGLLFIRLGAPSNSAHAKIVDQLLVYYPAESQALNIELAKLFSYLDVPESIPHTLTLIQESSEQSLETPYLSEDILSRSEQYGPTIAEMLKSMPARSEIALVHSLSHAERGWDLEERKTYFQWFADALQRKGGMSYKGFIDRIRQNAMETLTDAEKEALSDVNGQFVAYKATDLSSLPQAQGPGKNYSMSELRTILREAQGEKRSFEEGEKLYAAALCSSCHMMNGQGGNIGPDLSRAYTRFQPRDMLWAIVAPSDVISDQYAATQFNLKDGSSISGRFVEEKDGKIYVNTNPYDSQQSIEIAASEVESRERFPVSTMPPGLLNKLNPTEIADLMAYLSTGGDSSHELYQ